MLRTHIELTVEEIEMLLDLLGMDSPDDAEDKKHLRQRLLETLQYMRERAVPKDMA